MNSFILYRSAYAERILALVEQKEEEGKDVAEVRGGHRGVSKIAGESWRMETKEVRELFELWMVLEKRAHEGAWPEYRFLPKL